MQHNIAINYTITWQQKSRQTSKKQTNKQSKIRKFNRLTTTSRTNRKINNSARLLNYYKSTLIRNAEGGPLISVLLRIQYCKRHVCDGQESFLSPSV